MNDRPNAWLALLCLVSTLACAETTTPAGSLVGAQGPATTWRVEAHESGELVWHLDADQAPIASETRVVVDRKPPSIRWVWSQPHVRLASGEIVLTPTTGAKAEAADASGARVTGYQWDEASSGPRLPARLAIGTRFLVAEAQDAFGNTSHLRAAVSVDDTGPEITATLLSEVEGAPGFSTRPAVLEVQAHEAKLNTRMVVPDPASCAVASACRVEIDADQIELIAADALGNQSRKQVRWRYDETPPEPRLTLRGELVAPGSVISLAVDQAVGFELLDEGVGGSSAVYRYNQGEVRPLPDTLRFLDRGRYVLQVRTRDRIGNEGDYRWTVVAR